MTSFAAAPPTLETAEGATHGLRSRCRAARRATTSVLEAVDRCRTARTVPRGTGPSDDGHRAAVDARVWHLHVRYGRTGDARTLGLLVEEYDRYAVSLAVRLHREHESLDDLRQVAREGLIHALQRFDPERAIPFPALATPTIMGAIRRHYRDRGWAIRVPRRVHEITVASRRAEEHLTLQLGRVPRADEVAAHLQISVDELLEVHDAVHCRATTSIDDQVGPDGEAAGPTLGERDPWFARIDDRVDLRAALRTLDEREREVVRLYFFEERSQAEIGRTFGVSQMQVSRWLASILRRLRSHITDDADVVGAG